MPELPEVETIVRALRDGGRNGPSIVGKTVQAVLLLWERTLAEPPLAEAAVRLPGQQVQGVSRRAKFVVVHFNRDTLLVHLRMSGDLRVEPSDAPLQPHDRLALEFTAGDRLAFNDARKFGRAWLTDDPDGLLSALGPEPLDPAFTAQELSRLLRARHRQLKPLLLDQTFLAGMGNIYTDEALHLARLHPNRLSNSITPDEAERLWAAIHAVLEEGIRRNGASIDWVYRGGEFQNNFRAYQRTGQPCPVCGTPITRILVGQRSTHYCPVCQQLTGPTEER